MHPRQLFLLAAILVLAFSSNSVRAQTVRQPRERSAPSRTIPTKSNANGSVNGKTMMQEDTRNTRDTAVARLPEAERKGELVRAIGSGVVLVYVKNIFGEVCGAGSGFAFHKDGLILTNYHVVR